MLAQLAKNLTDKQITKQYLLEATKHLNPQQIDAEIAAARIIADAVINCLQQLKDISNLPVQERLEILESATVN